MEKDDNIFTISAAFTEKGQLTKTVSSIQLKQTDTPLSDEDVNRHLQVFEVYRQKGENITKYGSEPVQLGLYPDEP